MFVITTLSWRKLSAGYGLCQAAFLFIVLTGLAGCESKPTKPASPATANNDTKSQKPYFHQMDSSGIRVIKQQEGYAYEARSVSYDVRLMSLPKRETEQYICRQIESANWTSNSEGTDRTIRVDFLPLSMPNQSVLTIQQRCDKLTLNDATYQTTTYGCCADLDEYEVYDYANKLIIAGNELHCKVTIPNSELTLYTAFSPAQFDSINSGTLSLSYDSRNRYEVLIAAPSEEVHHRYTVFQPTISVKTDDMRDTYNKGENSYYLWSLDGVKTPEKVKGLQLEVRFDCDSGYISSPLRIPIIGGKPFGRADRKQKVVYGQ